MSEPQITVLMPVHNGGKYLSTAIESVLVQTFREMELLVVDDGSTDETPDTLAAYAGRDGRIRVIRNEANLGIVASLNRGIAEIRTPLTARMDADDISFSERLEKQYRFLEAHPTVALVGTWAEIWENEKNTGKAHRHPADAARIRFELLFGNPFVHSSVMMRTAMVREAGGYVAPRTVYPEDYDLWSRISKKAGVANIPEMLTVYRESDRSICRGDDGGLLAEGVAEISARNIQQCLREQGETVLTEEVLLFVRSLNRVGRHRVAAGSGAPSFGRLTAAVRRCCERSLSSDLPLKWYMTRRVLSLTVRAYRNYYLYRA